MIDGGEGKDETGSRDKLIKMTKYNFMFKSEEQKAVYELWYYLALKSNADVIKVFQRNVLSREIKTFFSESSFRFTSKLRGKHRDFPYNPSSIHA